jgi:peptide/nickel transport system substrate-binding protein
MWQRVCLILGLALVLASCSSTRTRSPSASPNGTLVIGAVREPSSLNPLLEEGYVSEQLGLLLFTFLVTVDEHGNQVPEAAREVPTLRNGGISSDGLRIVYHLRKDIRWQDGVPLTARDCVFTFAAIMNPRNNLPSRAGYDQIRRVTAPDGATVIVTLKRPYSPITDAFLAPDYNYPILPAHLLARYADLNQVPFNARPLGSGPFRVALWQRGDRLTVVRNDAFFRGRPKLARIVIKFVPSYDTIANQLMTHEVDAAFNLESRQYRRLRDVPGLATKVTPNAGALLLFFNTIAGPTADVRVRRAIVAATDARSLVRDFTNGYYGPDDAMRGIFTWAYTHVPEPHYDPRTAALILEGAGWKTAADGFRYKNGERLSITITTSTIYPTLLVTNLQQGLRQIGVDATIKSYAPVLYVAPGALGGPLFGLHYGLATFEILVGAGDPDTSLYLGCDQRPPSGFNFSALCDSAIETAQRDGASTYDRARRIHDALVVERLLRDRVPFLALDQTREFDAYTNRLTGFTPAPYTPYWNVWNWSLRSD